jgi:hypothetical protein
VAPLAESESEPVRQLHLACTDHPSDKRAANGKCIGCIVDRNNRLTSGGAS